MKLGIYGGTFNPPHLGHLTSARLALDALGLDELQFVPAALPPHKRLPPDAPGPEARLADSFQLIDICKQTDIQISGFDTVFLRGNVQGDVRSEEHTSELQSHSFISYAVFCLKK